eukprot:COSAG01_NODE_1728_length_9373_cov_25.243476_8_plen_41_part_00
MGVEVWMVDGGAWAGCAAVLTLDRYPVPGRCFADVPDFRR